MRELGMGSPSEASGQKETDPAEQKRVGQVLAGIFEPKEPAVRSLTV
jgi:hypothetical protein